MPAPMPMPGNISSASPPSVRPRQSVGTNEILTPDSSSCSACEFRFAAAAAPSSTRAAFCCVSSDRVEQRPRFICARSLLCLAVAAVISAMIMGDPARRSRFRSAVVPAVWTSRLPESTHSTLPLDQRLDLARSVGTALRQASHLSGDHGKKPRFARSRWPASTAGIQGEDVGLERDTVNHTLWMSGNLAACRADLVHVRDNLRPLWTPSVGRLLAADFASDLPCGQTPPSGAPYRCSPLRLTFVAANSLSARSVGTDRFRLQPPRCRRSVSRVGSRANPLTIAPSDCRTWRSASIMPCRLVRPVRRDCAGQISTCNAAGNFYARSMGSQINPHVGWGQWYD